MLLHVHPTGEVELVLPRWVSKAVGTSFLKERHDWIIQMLSSQVSRQGVQQPLLLIDGADMPCFGDSLTLSLEIDSKRKKTFIHAAGSDLIVRAPGMASAAASIGSWYKKEAQAYYSAQGGEYAKILGFSGLTIRARNMKTQWGSCSQKAKVLTFNWRLALGPEPVARYVAAHEVAHLLHPNHSPVFWSTVLKLYPEYEEYRAWLRKYGGGLYIAKS